jgi:hypothetical protein
MTHHQSNDFWYAARLRLTYPLTCFSRCPPLRLSFSTAQLSSSSLTFVFKPLSSRVWWRIRITQSTSAWHGRKAGIREKNSSCWRPCRPFILWTIRPFYRTIWTYSRASELIRLKSSELQDRPMHAKLKNRNIHPHLPLFHECLNSHSRFCLEP